MSGCALSLICTIFNFYMVAFSLLIFFTIIFFIQQNKPFMFLILVAKISFIAPKVPSPLPILSCNVASENYNDYMMNKCFRDIFCLCVTEPYFVIAKLSVPVKFDLNHFLRYKQFLSLFAFFIPCQLWSHCILFFCTLNIFWWFFSEELPRDVLWLSREG